MKNIHHSHHSAYSHHSHYEYPGKGQPATPAHQTGIKAKPSHDDVARKAYEIYLNEGRPEGRDVHHWLEAETQMSA
ncbi:MAG: hypothetical protein C0404_13065 [Verrucomicrobia bacterium]|nr:hypothetical protein [Verrucomicrobiota bacterium]